MTDRCTWSVVRTEAARAPGLTIIEPAETQVFADRVARRFVADRESRWWWSALRDRPVDVIDYGDDNAWERIRRIVPPRSDYVLLVTDEEPTPRGAVRGPLTALGALVYECPYFEYVITDDASTFAVFDTHHNSLVLAGDIAPRER